MAEFETTCLLCGYLAEVHTNVDGESPSPGAICVCWNCGHVASYGQDVIEGESNGYWQGNP